MRRTRRIVDEEGLVGHQGLLLAHPVDGLVGHVFGEVIAFFGRLGRLQRRGPFIDRRVILVGLAAEKAIEVLEAAAARGPRIERTQRAGLPHWHFVALAELRRAVAVELERLGQGRAGVGTDRGVARRGRGEFGDGPHADGVVVAPGQQRLPSGRAERGRVKAVVAQAVRGESLEVGRVAWPAECARRAEARIVEQDDEHIGCAGRRAQRLDGRELHLGVFGVVLDESGAAAAGNGQHRAQMLVGTVCHDHAPCTRPDRSTCQVLNCYLPRDYWRRMAILMSASVSWISSPDRSSVTRWMVPVNANLSLYSSGATQSPPS